MKYSNDWRQQRLPDRRPVAIDWRPWWWPRGRRAGIRSKMSDSGEHGIPVTDGLGRSMEAVAPSGMQTAIAGPLVGVSAAVAASLPDGSAPLWMLSGYPVVAVLFFFLLWLGISQMKTSVDSGPALFLVGMFGSAFAGIASIGVLVAHFFGVRRSEPIQAAFSKGDYDLAINLLNEAAKINYELDKIYLLRGIAKDKRGMDGKGDFDQAVTLAPNSAEAHFLRANYYYAHGQFADAITGYTDAIRLAPQHAQAYYNRGSAYFDSGKPEQARLSWEEARRLDPNVEQAADIIRPRQSS
jgi:hypothetical protein